MDTPAKPTPGRTVLYVLSESDVKSIIAHRRLVNSVSPVAPLISGNTPHAGDIVPAVVVRPWTDTQFNGQAFLDGDQTVWLTTVGLDQEGKKPGTWHWPEIEGQEQPAPSFDDYGKPFGKAPRRA